MIDSVVLYFLSSARRNVVAGILLDWSMRTASASFFVTEHSIHDPRSGMTRQPCSGRAVELVHDHALCAVDDELTAADHDWDLAEVDRILDDLVLILADEAHLD